MATRKSTRTSRSPKCKSTKTKKSSTKKEETQPTEEPIWERDNILICSKVYNALIKKAQQKRGWSPSVFMLGEDKKQIVREIVAVTKVTDSGCDEMPSINGESMNSAYFKLVKKKLTPVGLVRLSNDKFQYGGHWNGNSGSAIYRSVGYMLTVAQNIITGEVFVPQHPNFRDRSQNKYYDGRIKTLTVGLTDK